MMSKKLIADACLNAAIIFSFVLITVIQAKAQHNPIKFSNLTIEDGLSHTDIQDILQDKLGFIWLATHFGLNRYDGHMVKRFYNTNVPIENAFKNRINAISLDEKGKIWIASEKGIQVFDPVSEKYTDVDNVQRNTGNKTYDHVFVLRGDKLAVMAHGQFKLFSTKGLKLTDIPVKHPQGVGFTDMVSDSSGNIWLSSNRGIWLLDHSFRFRHFGVTEDQGHVFNEFDNISINRSGQLLVTSETTIILIKTPCTDLLSKAAPSIAIAARVRPITGFSLITDILQDKHQDYWIASNGGLFLLDSTLRIKQKVTSNSFNSLSSNNLNKLLIDRSECLWVSTLAKGINIYDLNAKPFYSIRHPTDSGNYITSILEESGKKLWIGTSNNGLNEYDLQTNKSKHYNKDSSPVKLMHDEILSMVLDNDNRLWLGTNKGMEILNQERNALWLPPGHEKFPFRVTSLAKDCYGNIWFGSFYNGFGSITADKKKNYKVTYHGGRDSGHLVWADSKRPELFVSSIHGLLRLVIDRSGNILQTFRYSASNHTNALSSNYTFQVQKQRDSTYWIGTIGGGLNRLILKKGNAYSITAIDKRIFKDVATIEFDNKNNIWIGGDGLQRFNMSTKALTLFDKNDGLQGNRFKTGASYKGIDGRLYFGGINGLNYFYPDSIRVNSIEARPIFTNLLINNKKVIIGSKDSLSQEIRINKSISYTNRLLLSYLQNDFSVSFSAMHYANPKKCQYRYKLIGFDKEWKFTDNGNPSASYNNLNYDDYTLIVQATNNDGIWSNTEAAISITVTPPWWKSTLAKFIYAILFLSVLIGIYIYQARWFRLKREISIHELEEKRKEELYHQIQEKNNVLQEADEFKNKLVSMLAHDFRSPLASTISIARIMRDNQGFTQAEMEEFYGDIENDANKMLESFDTILQWIKQQLSGYRLEPETLLIRDLLNESAAMFQQQISAKNITFLNQVPSDVAVITDKEMLQFINRNLLANAIKFSPEGGTVVASSTVSNGELTLGISDEGIGMSDKVLSNLFSVSTQVGSSNREGAGIALSMCKDFIQKLNGKIWAMNRKPNGAIFHYTIPAPGKTT